MKKSIILYLAASAKSVEIAIQRKSAKRIAKLINADVKEVITF